MMKNLQGRDVYEMWLRTSVGEEHSKGKGFTNFLCFGEGMFSDCVDRDRVIDMNGKVSWPGGDDQAEDDIEEVIFIMVLFEMLTDFQLTFSITSLQQKI